MLASLLAGCLSFGTPAPVAEKGVWVRADGQSGKNNPALAAQFESDRAACSSNGQINRTCMSRAGYVLVPESQAAATAAQLRAKAATAPAPSSSSGM